MSDTVELAQESQQEAVAQSASFLDMAVEATKSSENNLVEQLLKGLSNAAVDGAVVWDKNVTRTLKKAQSAVDQMISQQLNEIMHNEAFQKLEGSWRGLQHLVDNTETGSNLSIKMFDMKKLEPVTPAFRCGAIFYILISYLFILQKEKFLHLHRI